MIRNAIVMLLFLTGITGLLYPLAITALARALFPDQASGSLIREDERISGSRLIGQYFDDPRYFWSRPSATSPSPYNAASSAGSNYGPLSPSLQKAIADRRAALRSSDPDNHADVPADLLMSSASGLDPDISPAAAEYQAGRIARVRHLKIDVVRGLIAAHTVGRQWGFLGEARVNVVSLNRALDGR